MARLGQFRRDTAANWEAANPIIADGEFILIATNPGAPKVYDAQKVGDGQTRYNSLPMRGFETVQELGDGTLVPLSQKTATEVFSEVSQRLSGAIFSISGRIDINGNPQGSETGLKRTTYVSIPKGVTQVTAYGFSSEITALIAFYDETKTFISSVFGEEENGVVKTIDVPTNARFCVCTGEEGKSFLLISGVEQMFNRLLISSFTNVTKEYPLPDDTTYYTLQTARLAVPIGFRKGGHLISFRSDYQNWQFWYYKGFTDQNNNDSGWFNNDFWTRFSTSEDITPLQADVDYLKVATLEKENDVSDVPLNDTYIIDYRSGNYLVSGTTQAATQQYIDCLGANYLEISLPTGASTESANGLAFYDKDKKYISGVQRPIEDTVRKVIKNIKVPTGAAYFRTSYFNTANRVTYGEFFCKVHYENLVETPYTEVFLDSREICDGNYITTFDGSVATAASAGCTSYIDCAGALQLKVMFPQNVTEATFGLAFYDSTKNFISSVPRPVGTKGAVLQEVEIPDNAAYFRTSYWNFAEMKALGIEFQCSIRYPKGFLGHEKYRPYQSGQIHFRVEVNQSVSNFWGTSNVLQDSYSPKGSTGVLVLPDTYSPTGKPVKAIMYCHGMSRNVSYTRWGLNDANFLAQKERWRSLGYAVFDCNGQNDNGGAANHTNGTPQAVSAYRKSLEYILQYYNIEPDIYVVGGSMGGDVALNYCFTYGNVRALAMISAWTDLENCAWGQGVRQPFVTYFGFNDTTTYEAEKVQGYDPSKRIIMVGETPILPCFKYPFKYWVGSSEAGSVLYNQAVNTFIPALKNGGNNAVLRVVTGVGHEIVAGGSEIVDNEIGYWFSKF